MPDEPTELRLADPDDVRQAIEFALSFDGKRRFRHADGLAAAITADHLVKHLEKAGYVAMKRPPRKAHSTPG